MIENITINTNNIKLDQFIKWANIVSSGGEAKILISNGIVKVNGKVIEKRGFQLKKGDIVEIDKKGCFRVVPSKE